MDDILSYHQHGNLSSPYASIILHRRSVSLLHPLGLGLSCHVASKPPTFSNASLLTHKVAPIPHPCLSMTSSPWPKKLPFSAQSITIIFASSKCLFPSQFSPPPLFLSIFSFPRRSKKYSNLASPNHFFSHFENLPFPPHKKKK